MYTCGDALKTNTTMNTLLPHGIQIMSVNTLNKNAVFPTGLTEDEKLLRLNIVELPEMISVETRFLSHQNAINAQIETLHTLSEPTELETKLLAEELKINYTEVNCLPITPTKTEPEKIVETADASTLTDSENPKRDREQQTDNIEKSSVDIAIQCSLEHDMLIELEEASIGINGNDENTTTATEGKEEFLKYINGKIQCYSNGKQECLLCGEIKLNTKIMHKHMAMHYGPAVLCFLCGLKFEHEELLKHHRCEMRKKRRQIGAGKRTHIISCPHYRCRVKTISPVELYDHINEHIGEHLYYCHACKRGFCTAGEYRHHLPLRLKCLESAKRRMPYKRFNSKAQSTYRMRVFTVFSFKKKRIIVKNFLSQREQTKQTVSQRCQICLKHFGNEFKFGRHNRRCLSSHLRRLKKRRFPPTTSLTNGHVEPI